MEPAKGLVRTLATYAEIMTGSNQNILVQLGSKQTRDEFIDHFLKVTPEDEGIRGLTSHDARRRFDLSKFGDPAFVRLYDLPEWGLVPCILTNEEYATERMSWRYGRKTREA